MFKAKYRVSNCKYLYFAKMRNVFDLIRDTIYIRRKLYIDQLTFNDFKSLF